MSRSARISLWLLVLLFSIVSAFKACTLSEEQIRRKEWKFADDDPSPSPPGELLHFGAGGLVLRADTIYRQDTALAVVRCAYRKYEGSERLFIRVLGSPRVVEYFGW